MFNFKRSIFILIPFLIVNILSSVAYSETTKVQDQSLPKNKTIFDQDKWRIKQGKDYPYRDEMLNDIVYTDKFRTLKKNEIIAELGEPSYYRDDKDYLYYVISQTRLLSWPLHTKTLVIKISKNNSVEWIKIHK
jgi:hypothetical protein